ncbi:hypothetical protein Ocin01_20167 [Orchesella cincta]|uniref:Uncharacterized protein n=1 Tax=Orchesella cincta TaxID=48709 RepID=A0A1D2M0M9_ORCCI|nr:hypothetical protein Ocin01_20167 [Orchesella cincta]
MSNHITAELKIKARDVAPNCLRGLLKHAFFRDFLELSRNIHNMSQMSTPTNKRQRMEMETDLSSSTLPSFDLRFDRYCPACSRIIPRAALRKFDGQKCGVCCAKIEGRSNDGSLWDHCVDCDSWIKCTERFCYNCKYENEFYSPSKPARVEAEARVKWENIFKQELEDEKALVDAAIAYDASQTASSRSVSDDTQSEPLKNFTNDDSQSENSKTAVAATDNLE